MKEGGGGGKCGGAKRRQKKKLRVTLEDSREAKSRKRSSGEMDMQ